jgi:hypothetical protein
MISRDANLDGLRLLPEPLVKIFNFRDVIPTGHNVARVDHNIPRRGREMPVPTVSVGYQN